MLALARLLTPEDFGLFGMATVLVGFVAVLNDVGIGPSTIQKAKLEEAELNTLFWLQLRVSCVASGVIALASPALAWAFEEPKVLWIGLALSPSLTVLGAYSQHRALCKRSLDFKSVALIDFLTALISSALAVLAAWSGLGVWSLVVRDASSYVFQLLAYWKVTAWRPSWAGPQVAVSDHIRFSKFFIGSQVAKFLGRSLDKALLGFYFGPSTLGAYERSNALLSLPVRQLSLPLSSVVTPSLSRQQEDPGAFRRMYLQSSRLLFWTLIPVMVFLSAHSEAVVSVLLGDQWDRAAPIFAVLSVSVAFRALEVSRTWLFVPLGHADRLFRFTFASSLVYAASVGAFAWMGPEATAWAKGAAACAVFVVGVYASSSGTPVQPSDIYRCAIGPFMAGGLLFAIPVLLRHMGVQLSSHPVVALSLHAGIAALVMLTVSYFSGELARLLAFVRSLRRPVAG